MGVLIRSRNVIFSNRSRARVVGLIPLTISLLVSGGASGSAVAQINEQRLTNVEQSLLYTQGIEVFDTIDADTATRNRIEIIPDDSGSASSLAATFGLLDTVGTFGLSSSGSASNTFDIKAASEITIDATLPGRLNRELSPDGKWDTIVAKSHTSFSVFDLVLVLPKSADDIGKPGKFNFHWKPTNNVLDVEHEAVEEVVGETELGPITLLRNGFSTKLDYEVGFAAFADDVLVEDIVKDDSIELPAPRAAGLHSESYNVPLDEVSFSIDIILGHAFQFETYLSALLDMELSASLLSRPEVNAVLDLSNTFDSISFQPLDADGNPLEGATVVSELGLDYLGAAPDGSDGFDACDLNQDGLCNAADIDSMRLLTGDEVISAYDLNSDDVVDERDREVWTNELMATYFGDADLDGEFNTTDLLTVFRAGVYEDGIDGNATWESGDWNGDFEFDSGDLLEAFKDGGFEVGPRAASSVPEPGCFWLLLGGASVFRRRMQVGRG